MAKQLIEFSEEFALMTGQEAAVDLGGCGLRDDVHLVAGSQHRGISRVRQGCTNHASDRPYLGECRGGFVMRKTHTQRLAGSLKEGGHRPSQPEWPPMPPDPRDRATHLA